MGLQLSYLLSLLLLILLLPYSTTAQTSSNQSLGSSLTAQEKDSYWASPSGDFAFGFSQFGKGGYLLAIWFNKLPEKTIVWSANGDNLVPGGSKVELTKDGKFVLNDPAGLEIWKVNFVSSGVAYADMLDTRNFVLTMSQGSKLVARYSEMNYSNGRFQFQLRLNGSLVLQTRAYPTDYSYADYWPEEPIGSGFKDFYQRAIMEYDGVLRHYVYPKSSLMSRSCYCMLDGYRPKCQCPDGYTFIDPEDAMKGCKQNFLSQSCDEALPESDLFYLKSMPNTDWPGLSDYEFFLGQDED
ncbi:G-type lectin S-receptor-like serine/threonine-protein kinase LECRK3 [Quercus robur]|uniref:G-type lectin S-receptor-like serine/threonine-protein kinase LECRK3 n=1 Tax=Quercus robur TaxID=38942 RepID=UPI0021622723|nr:G-type lectin S-receptor-like serine/threonine-protein kinase LECRK3 [Quercus robur]